MKEELISRSGLYKLTVYVPEKDENMVKDFIDKCRRTDTTASTKILGFISSEMPNHEEKQDACSLCGTNVPLISMYDARFVSGRRFTVCSKCFKEKEAKGLVKSIIRKPES